MPVFDLQGTRCQRPAYESKWDCEKPLVKPHIITAQRSAASKTTGIQCEVSPYSRLTARLTSDERLVQEQAVGTRIRLYRLYGELGAGNFARVKLAVHQLTSERVAVKTIEKVKLDHEKYQMLTEEVANMERLHHPNIIRLYEMVETARHIHLVMEYAPCGDLYRRVTTHGRLREDVARTLVVQLLSAVQHMHENNLVHRDIKAQNVLLSSPTRAKLGDLGFSCRVTSIQQPLTQFCGSPPYAAPELLSAASYRGDAADLWALGVLVFFAVCGELPFGGDSLSELRGQVLAGRYQWPSGVGSESCRQLVAALLSRSPDLRPSAAAAGRCRWLRGHPPPTAGRRLTLRPVPGCGQERAARAQLRRLGVSAASLEAHRRRGLHSAVTGLYRLVLHGICREQEDRADSAAAQEVWLRPNGITKPCTIL